MVEYANALHDKRRQKLRPLIARDGAMNPRREDHAQVVRRDAERDQAACENVYDLRAPRRARRVRDDDQNALAGAYDLFERLRVERVVDDCAYLRIRQRSLFARLRFEHVEPSVLELE